MSDFNVNFNGSNYNDNNVPNEIKLSGKDDVLSIFDRNKDGKLSKKELKDAILSFLQEEKNVSGKFSDSKISDQEAAEIAKHFKNGYYKIGENIQKLIKELQSRISSSRNNIINQRKASGIYIDSIKKGDMRNVLPSHSDLFIDCGDNKLYMLDGKHKYKSLDVSLDQLRKNNIVIGNSDAIIAKNGKCYFATLENHELTIKDQDGQIVQYDSNIPSEINYTLNLISELRYEKEKLFQECINRNPNVQYKRDVFEKNPPLEYKVHLERINAQIDLANENLMRSINRAVEEQNHYNADITAQEEKRNKTPEETEPKNNPNKVISIKKINSSGQSEKTFWDNENGRLSIQALNYKKQAYAKAGYQAKVLGLTKEVSENYHNSTQGLSRILDKLTGQYEETTYYTRTDENGIKEYYMWDEAGHCFYKEK